MIGVKAYTEALIRMVHDDLLRMRESSKGIEQLRERIARLEAMRLSAGISSYGAEHVSSGAQGDKMLGGLIRMEELHELYGRELEDMLELQADFEHALEPLTLIEKCVMRYYYIDALTWENVAARMNYSIRHVIRIAKRAERKCVTA